MNSSGKRSSPESEGRREQKKRETRKRIAETGLTLFVKNGYESTTLDEIAAEAGIARRTFFYYFKSKEAILMAYLDEAYGKSGTSLLLAQPTEQGPLAAVRDSLLQIMAAHETEEAIVVDSLLGSTDALKARMQANYVEKEGLIFQALCELWPQPERRAALRLVAMVSMGALRVAKEAWRQEGGKRPLTEYLRDSFAALEGVVSGDTLSRETV